MADHKTVVDKKRLSLNGLIDEMLPVDFSKQVPISAMQLSEANRAVKTRFFQVTEIPEESSSQYRLAMTNVLSGLQNPDQSMVYLLSGSREGVKLFIGVSSKEPEVDIHDAGDALKNSFKGNFLGANLEKTEQVDDIRLGKHIGFISGVPSFNEDESASGGEDVQGIERLVNSLLGETWQLTIIAEALSGQDIRSQIRELYGLSTELSEHIKLSMQASENSGWNLTKTEGTSDSETFGSSRNETRGKTQGTSDSKGSNTGRSSYSGTSSSGKNQSYTTNDSISESIATGESESHTEGKSESYASAHSGGDSTSLSRERMDKKIEALHQYINDSLLNRYYLGRTKGLFKTAIYVSADQQAVYDRLTNGVVSLFQGDQVSMVPMIAHKLKLQKTVRVKSLIDFKYVEKGINTEFWQENALLQSIPINSSNQKLMAATAITTKELTLVAGMPSIELPGLKIRKSVNFAVNVPNVEQQQVLSLGGILQHGRDLSQIGGGNNQYQVNLNKQELNKHTFVCGVTGSGKTTTCMRLLLESEQPFMVVEPAKTEYRALYEHDEEIEYYAVGREDLTVFRLNPFELIRGEQLFGHIQMLKATLQAVFPMEAAMPYMVEEAVINAYKEKGWDIYSTENYLIEDPWAQNEDAWPVFSDMIKALDGVIKSKGLGQEFQEKYQGSLVARFTNLTIGSKGRMLNTKRSMNFEKLLDKRVVIELEEIKDEEDKALLMGLILVRLAETMKYRHRQDKNFRHLTLVEEAHRLLSKVQPGDPESKKMGVEMFSNLLAEVRKYGEGLVIADQIPNKLVSDVIKNTNTKIVHRLFAADDRETIGDTMSLDPEQKEFLPLLKVGEAVVYSGGWHAPVWVKVTQSQNTTGQVIDESLIKKKGVDQLWNQRHILLPRLSKDDFFTPESLSQFMQDGIGAINRFLKLLKLKQHEDCDSCELVRASIIKKLSSWRERMDGDSDLLGKRMALLYLDLVNRTFTDTFNEVFQTAWVKLFASLEEFMAFSNKERVPKKRLENITPDSKSTDKPDSI